jgi:hypothetical protein
MGGVRGQPCPGARGPRPARDCGLPGYNGAHATASNGVAWTAPIVHSAETVIDSGGAGSGTTNRGTGALLEGACTLELRLFAVAALLALLGCSSPTEPTPAAHPREALIADLARCYAQARGVVGELTIQFADDLGDTDCSYYLGPGARCSVAGRALPYSNAVTFWGPWVRGDAGSPAPLGDLALAAAHEVCHLSGVWGEDDADRCSQLLVGSADCLTRYADDTPEPSW